MSKGNMKVIRINTLPGFILFLSVLLAPVSYGQDMQKYDNAGLIVDELHTYLIDAMKDAESLGYQGRYELLHDVISRNFDTELIVQVILSRYWNELGQEQKDLFVELFNTLSISTYASRFDAYSGEYFQENSRQELRRERLLIKTELVREDDTNVNLDYLMHDVDGKWLIISVIANGVNDLSLKRAEYAEVIKNKGFDGLIEEIEKKISEMESDEQG
jgi:phospholipid transport system substrate-binding protein